MLGLNKWAMFLISLFTALITLTITYAIIPTIAPDIAGTPAAWFFTLMTLPFQAIFLLIMLKLAQRGGD